MTPDHVLLVRGVCIHPDDISVIQLPAAAKLLFTVDQDVTFFNHKLGLRAVLRDAGELERLAKLYKFISDLNFHFFYVLPKSEATGMGKPCLHE